MGIICNCENFADGLFAALVQGDGLQPAVGRGLGDRHQADGGGTLLLREAGRRAAAGGHAGRPHQDVECSRQGVGGVCHKHSKKKFRSNKNICMHWIIDINIF